MAGRRIPLGVQLADANLELATVKDRAAALERELAEFKALVRKTALDAKVSEGWCKPGFNTAMGQLGLEKLPDYFEVEVTVAAIQKVTIQLDADELADHGNTLDEAGVRLFAGELDNISDAILDSAYDDGWTYDEVTVESVTPRP